MAEYQYKVGDRVNPLGTHDKFGWILNVDDPNWPLVGWDEGVVSAGTDNPINEAVGDLQPVIPDDGRLFHVQVALGNESCGAWIRVEGDNIYQAEIGAELRALCRRVEHQAGLRESDELA